MARSTLAVYCYNLATGVTMDYSDVVEDLTLTTTSPGGYGDFTATIKVADARLMAQRSELALFSRVAVMDGSLPAWQGRIDEPAIVLDTSNGEEVQVHAMGASDCLKDDPADMAYQGQTAQGVLVDQLTNTSLGRNVTLTGSSGWLDPDTSFILPSNPGGTYYVSYPAYDVTQVANDLLSSLGDYTWAVWGHPNAQVGRALHTDAAGFPSWVLQVHPRDLQSVTYTGYLADESAHDIRPSVEYAYNAVRLKYRDANTQQPASVTVADNRLQLTTIGGQLVPAGQGSAPFPWRCFAKDLTNLTLTSAQATALGNAILADNLNGGSKIQIQLARVCDANGAEIPLWQVRADANILLPELAPLAQQLPTVPTTYTGSQGGNVFYITETEYRESQDQTPILTVTCNSFSDKSTFQFNRLQLLAESKLRNQTVTALVQAKGASETGYCGVQWGGTALGGDIYGQGVNFKTYLSAVPSSISLTADAASNAGAANYSDLTVFGFHFSVTVNANGPGYWRGQYKTVGN